MDGGNKGEEDLKLIPLLKDRSMQTHFPQGSVLDRQSRVPRLLVEIHLLILKSLLEDQGSAETFSWIELLVGIIFALSLYLASIGKHTQFPHCSAIPC